MKPVAKLIFAQFILKITKRHMTENITSGQHQGGVNSGGPAPPVKALKSGSEGNVALEGSKGAPPTFTDT